MAIKRVFSAGGIVLRLGFDKLNLAQDPSEKSRIEVLVTQHSGHHGWDFPKGHIELAESSEQAAIREVEEETGVRAEIIEKVGSTQYFYFDAGEKILKQVTFFLMKYIGEGKATTAFEVSDHKWLVPEKVESQLTFKDTKELWRKAKERIGQLTIND